MAITAKFGRLLLLLVPFWAAGCAQYGRHPYTARPPELSPVYRAVVSGHVASVCNRAVSRDPCRVLTGSEQTALQRALRWLAAHQQPDGSWDSHSPVRTTALALMTLASGTHPDSDAVRRAAGWLVTQQQPDGRWPSVRGRQAPLDQALAVQALAHATRFFPDGALEDPLRKGAVYILDHQQAGGGWGYAYGRMGYRSTLVTACQITALKDVVRAGMLCSSISSALLRAAADVLHVQDAETGRFGDEFRGIDRWSATGEGVAALQAAGLGSTPEARKGLAALEYLVNGWLGAADWPLLEAWFSHRAMAAQGGWLWDKWRPAISRELLAYAQPEGYWLPPGDEYVMGPAYATALCCLFLQEMTGCPDRAHLLQGHVPPAWVLEKNGQSCFVLSGVPLQHAELYALPEAWLTQYAQADALLLPWDMQRVETAVAESGAVERPCTLSADMVQRVARILQVPMPGRAALKTVAPWALAAACAEQMFLTNDIRIAELEHFFRYSCGGKRVHCLLSDADVVDLLQGMDCATGIALLKGVLDLGRHSPEWPRTLARAWTRGDLHGLQQMLWAMPPDQAQGIQAQFMEPLNRALADALDTTKPPAHTFVLLPVPVVSGPRNVLVLLQARGWRVDQWRFE
jgi:uncharacterized protein YbaP (TraB family)